MPSIQKTLVPVVLADTARHVVHQAAWSARRFHAEVALLHVVTPFGYPAGILESGHEIPARDLHAHIVQRAQADLDQALRPELLPEDGGDSDSVIAAFAKAGVDHEQPAADLQREGAVSFVELWNDLLTCIGSKSATLKAAG
jgi:nucleotide-binding universal stress UspA family protein